VGFAYLTKGRNEENNGILVGVTFPHAHALRALFFQFYFPPLRRLPRRLVPGPIHVLKTIGPAIEQSDGLILLLALYTNLVVHFIET